MYNASHNSIIKNEGRGARYKSLKVKLMMFLAGHIVTMVTCYTNKMTATCLSTIGHLYNNIIVVSLVKQYSSKVAINVMETVASLFK